MYLSEPHPNADHFKASYFKKLKDQKTLCQLCPHNCVLEKDKLGACKTRKNIDGEMVVLTYGRMSAMAIDPIEKKPLNHFRPGSLTFSIASAGCNLKCPFCQNYNLSQDSKKQNYNANISEQWTANHLVNEAKQHGCSSISFTYSEPILSFEFARETSKLAKLAGIDTVFVSNGQLNEKPAHELATFISAANIDLKSFNSNNYCNILGGKLDATLKTIDILAQSNVWVEVTTLIIPGFNDSKQELSDIAQFIVNINPSIPWHVSRFYPTFNWHNKQSTTVETLKLAHDIGRERGLKYVYTGNISSNFGQKTYCFKCKKILIDRSGYKIVNALTKDTRCKHCGTLVDGLSL